MASPRKKALEDFAKDVERGIPLAEDYTGKSGDVLSDSLYARNLAEEALAQKVLDNTGIPIPDKSARKAQLEDFFAQLLDQTYPELNLDKFYIEPIPDQLKVEGYFDPKTKNIVVNQNSIKNNGIVSGVGTLFHEAGHAYDDVKKITPKITQDDFNKELRRLKAEGFDLKNADPAQVYELMAEKHHAKIPKLREGTYGLGALKSYLKSGTFKGMAPLLAKGAAAGAGGLASLAAEAADSEEEGSSTEQAALLREIDQANREKKILKAIPEQNRARVMEELENQRLGIRRNALEDIIKK